jgi:hypothetical protein
MASQHQSRPGADVQHRSTEFVDLSSPLLDPRLREFRQQPPLGDGKRRARGFEGILRVAASEAPLRSRSARLHDLDVNRRIGREAQRKFVAAFEHALAEGLTKPRQQSAERRARRHRRRSRPHRTHQLVARDRATPVRHEKGEQHPALTSRKACLERLPVNLHLEPAAELDPRPSGPGVPRRSGSGSNYVCARTPWEGHARRSQARPTRPCRARCT